MYCEKCQSEYEDGRKFCPGCGERPKVQGAVMTAPSPQTCPNCGKDIQPGKKFCLHCGANVSPRPRLCSNPECLAVVRPEAQFCGECGAGVMEAEDKTQILPPLSPPPLGDESSTIPLHPPKPSEGGAAPFAPWWQKPELHFALECLQIALLLVLCVLSYRLSTRPLVPGENKLLPPPVVAQPTPTRPPSVETPAQPTPPPPVAATPPPPSPPVATPVPTPPPAPSVATASTPQPEVAPPPQSPIVTPPPPPVAAPPTEPSPPPPSGRFYRVTEETDVLDKPSWTGKSTVQVKPKMEIYVIAVEGDWLKVQSQKDPSQPPGYVWHEHAKPK